MAASDPDIAPDTKDWTWVLESSCPECGFDTRRVTPADIPDVVRANAAGWPPVLNRADAAVRRSAGVWSPLEYGCHVRDVFEVFTARLQRMLSETDPLFDNWDQDATALEDDYRTQNPGQVAEQLTEAAERAAAAFAAVPDTDWQRTARRTDGAHFTVETLGRYFVHDPEHHLWDVSGTTAWSPPDGTSAAAVQRQ